MYCYDCVGHGHARYIFVIFWGDFNAVKNVNFSSLLKVGKIYCLCNCIFFNFWILESGRIYVLVVDKLFSLFSQVFECCKLWCPNWVTYVIQIINIRKGGSYFFLIVSFLCGILFVVWRTRLHKNPHSLIYYCFPYFLGLLML